MVPKRCYLTPLNSDTFRDFICLFHGFICLEHKEGRIDCQGGNGA